jgi:predicted dehydrogenase
MSKKLRVVQIGAGNFGQSWIQLLLNYPGVELVSVADVFQSNLDRAKSAYNLENVAIFNDTDAALQQSNADMALIVTPPKTHMELATSALKNGLHVMMEKPLTHTYEEAIELFEFSKTSDRIVMVSQNYRWRPVIQTLKKLVKEKAVGEIGYMQYEFSRATQFGGWRDEYKEVLLEDMAIHHFDIMRFLLDQEAEEIYAQSFRPAWSWFSGNPSASVTVQFANGVTVSYFGSWVARGKETTWNGNIRIVGDKGAIELVDDRIEVHLYDGAQKIESYAVDPVPMPYDERISSLDDMVKSIINGSRPETSIENNIRSFELTCAAILSVQQGQKINIERFRGDF